MPKLIQVPEQKAKRYYDEEKNEFIYIPAFEGGSFVIEHSLLSISKWETKWHVPFITNDGKSQKTDEQMIDYIKCMNVSKHSDDRIYGYLTPKNFEEINEYINDPMTATVITDKTPNRKSGPSKKPITNEVIYYWMIELGIPLDLQKWHINRLLTLIRVIEIERAPKKNMPMHEVMKSNSELNKARRAAMNSKG